VTVVNSSLTRLRSHPMATVTALIPTYNQRDLLETLLRNLRRQTRPPDEVLVIDDGSDDGSAAVASQSGANVLEMGMNTGFCRAVNRGIREANGDYLAIINNDVELDEAWLERLVADLEASGASFAAGKLLRAGSVSIIDGSHDEISRAACPWRCGEGRNDGPLWSEPKAISLASFTAVLFRREVFSELGLLDEAFESYLEDVDFGLRCAGAGRGGRYVPEATALHRGSATLGAWNPRKVRLLSRNQLLLVAKHYPRYWWVRLGWPVLVGQLLWGGVAFRHGTGWAFLRGKLDGLRMFRRIRRNRGGSAATVRFLKESEDRIERLQRESGFDWYWRLYFALT